MMNKKEFIQNREKALKEARKRLHKEIDNLQGSAVLLTVTPDKDDPRDVDGVGVMISMAGSSIDVEHLNKAFLKLGNGGFYDELGINDDDHDCDKDHDKKELDEKMEEVMEMLLNLNRTKGSK